MKQHLVWVNNIYSREPSGSISVIDACQWKYAAKKMQMSGDCSRYYIQTEKILQKLQVYPTAS